MSIRAHVATKYDVDLKYIPWPAETVLAFLYKLPSYYGVDTLWVSKEESEFELVKEDLKGSLEAGLFSGEEKAIAEFLLNNCAQDNEFVRIQLY